MPNEHVHLIMLYCEQVLLQHHHHLDKILESPEDVFLKILQPLIKCTDQDVAA